MIIFPFPEGNATIPDAWKYCCLILDVILGVCGAFYIYALYNDSGGMYYICSSYSSLDKVWILSLICTVGRNVTTFISICLFCINIKSSIILGCAECLYYISFVVETLPGLLLFHILEYPNKKCFREFVFTYELLHNAIMMQGFISFVLVLFTAFGFTFTCLVFLLGDHLAWSRNSRHRQFLIVDEGNSHGSGQGYVIDDNRIFI